LEGGYFQIGPPPGLPEWKQPRKTAPLTGIRVRSIQEGEGVRIKVGAIFDDSQPVDAPGPKYGEREQFIAAYFVQLDETVTVHELESFGVEAITLRVVKYKPPPIVEPAPAILPEVVNELKSIAFVDLKSDGDVSSHFYRLTLQNVATKSIVALTVRIAPGHTQSEERSRDNPLMLPGATYQTSINISESDVPDNSRSTLVIQTVLFDDGSYDGDVVAAASMAARTRGRQIQLARFLLLLQDDLAKPGSEASSIIQELKTSAAKFRIDVDASVVDELQSQFPSLPKKNDRVWLASTVMEGLKSGRGHAPYLLKDLEVKHTPHRESSDLHQSLRALMERIARLAGNQ